MPQIYIAAMGTTLLCVGFIGGVLYYLTPVRERLFLLALCALLLPMCALAFYGVRTPLDRWLSGALAHHKAILGFLRVFYAPLTEEPAKLWVIALPSVYRRITSRNLVRVAVAMGLGFGIGEAWTIAGFVARNPAMAAHPWYAYGGFVQERFMVCLMHAGFVAVALQFIIARRRPVTGVVCAMVLHFVGNFPLYLAQVNFLNLGRNVWPALLSLWVTLYFVLMCAVLAFIAFIASRAERTGAAQPVTRNDQEHHEHDPQTISGP